MRQALTYFKQFAACSICLISAFILLIASYFMRIQLNNQERVAKRVEHQLSKRISLMEKYLLREMDADKEPWSDNETLPEDIILYRYDLDTLTSWKNVFPILNDNIRTDVRGARLTNSISGGTSQLSDIEEHYSFLDIGSRCYLARMCQPDKETKFIIAMEICSRGNTGEFTNVSPALKLPENFCLGSLSADQGSPVKIDGKEMFLICNNNFVSHSIDSLEGARWMALALIIIASILALWRKRSILLWLTSMTVIAGGFIISHTWGNQLQGSKLFSPSLYADGPVWSSFGNLMLLNLLITSVVLCCFFMRKGFLKYSLKALSGQGTYVYGAILLTLALGITTYIIFSFKSLILNSSISFFIQPISRERIYVYITLLIYSLLSGSILLIAQMFRPVKKKLWGLKSIRQVNSKSVLVHSLIFCLLLFSLMQGLNVKKEEQRAQVWANRMTIDRDLGTELILRSEENAIASDAYIPMLLDNDLLGNSVSNWIAESHLYRTRKTHNINVSLYFTEQSLLEKVGPKMNGGIPIADQSRFLYCPSPDGRHSYSSVFVYKTQERGLVWIVVELVPSHEDRSNDFMNIFMGSQDNISGVTIPDIYSWAKYVNDRQVSFKGSFSYPTVLENKVKQQLEAGRLSFQHDNYIHYINKVEDNEVILISRPTRGTLSSTSTFLLFLLIMTGCLEPFLLISIRKPVRIGNTFTRRISSSLLIIFIISLTLLVAVSVTFVFDRNKADVEKLLTNRINTIEAMIENTGRQLSEDRSNNPERIKSAVDAISRNTQADITLFSPEGRAIVSSAPEVFSDMLKGTRMDDDAYYSLKYRHSKLYKKNQVFNGRKYMDLFAPVLGASGELVAILHTPYTRNDNIMRDAMPHAILLIVISLVLIAVSQVFISKYVKSMFGPLSEVSRRMEDSDIHSLQYIIYKPKDEIATLVNAYNTMVHDLSESTRELARSERDKAWSEMARQVAHEIKNPLTPIKLEIQRLIRLKAKNDLDWDQKFDHVSKIILEHIDILTDTANEFSTFAMLYDQEPVEVDLNKVLEEQILIFDNKENIDISYMGLKDAVILGPRPQLIRVFVNLITNAIQAIELSRDEESAAEKGKILICLRNGAKDGYFDIVIEDNGPGVKEENLQRLFTPNFTTKSSGTGLGLAICQKIVERCKGSINYKRSFTLGGACFTVSLPKNA